MIDSSDDENYNISNNEYIITNDSKNNIKNDQDIITTNDGLIFNPYNNKNQEITKSDIIGILNKFNIHSTPFNIKLYQRAFIHKSYLKRPHLENIKTGVVITEQPDDCIPLKTKSNERLEFIGDGVLECITKYYLYRRFPKADEGFMTEKKIALVKNEHIGKLAYEMGLYKWFIISKHAEEKQTRTNLKKLGCLFEAFIGALFLDFNKIDINDENGWFQNIFVTGPGFQMAQKFIENIFEELVDWDRLINNDDNFKNRLQVIIQKEFKITPDYVELENNENGYVMGLYISLGDKIYNMDINKAVKFENLGSFSKVHEEFEKRDKLLVFLTKQHHKIKKKAEQLACDEVIKLLNK
tara:strand:- start:10819 stop:11880 length:1062 start_codon:yes stop_codon:yes gene_type:complete